MRCKVLVDRHLRLHFFFHLITLYSSLRSFKVVSKPGASLIIFDCIKKSLHETVCLYSLICYKQQRQTYKLCRLSNSEKVHWIFIFDNIENDMQTSTSTQWSIDDQTDFFCDDTFFQQHRQTYRCADFEIQEWSIDL